jgi:cytochrome c551/c552
LFLLSFSRINLEKRGISKLSKKRNSKNHKTKKSRKLEDVYRLLERIYYEVCEDKYKSKRLSNLVHKVQAKPSSQLRYAQPYARTNEQKYPLLKSSSQAGARPWTEPAVYRPPERLVYDPDVKHLLEKIEAHLRLDTETKSLEELDVDELLSRLQQKYNGEAYGKLLEKLLEEINKAESKPELQDAESLNQRQYGYKDLQEISENSVEKESMRIAEQEELENMLMRANEAAIEANSDKILEKMLASEEAGERMREEFLAEAKTQGNSEQIEAKEHNESEESIEQRTEKTEELECSEPEVEPEENSEAEIEIVEAEEAAHETQEVSEERMEADGSKTVVEENTTEIGSSELPVETLSEAEPMPAEEDQAEASGY